MPFKTLSKSGAVFALLCLIIPARQGLAAEATAAPFLTANSSAAIFAEEQLTLRAVLDRALLFSPELTAYDEESRARAAELSQSSRLLNPELNVEVANVAGSGAYNGFDTAETTVLLSQQLELGNKRLLRREVAEVEHHRSRHDLASARIDVQARIARQFWAVMGAQEHLKLADEQIDLASRTLETVVEKIAAGKAAAVEKHRFQSALAETRLVKEKAALTLATARRTLADSLGLEAKAMARVIGNLTDLPPLPAYNEIETQTGQSPETIRRQLESEAKRRALALERAHRLVDPTIGLGLRNFKDSADNALVFAITLPLPLFDRNQGNVQAASSRLAAAQAQEANGLLQSRAVLAESWQALAASSVEARALRDQIIPSAQQAFEAAGYGYQSGKFAVLEMLDAQRTLIEARERYLDVLTAAQLAAVELDRLLGRAPISTTIDQFAKE